MGRAKGKAGASTKKAVPQDAAVVASEAAALVNDSAELENNLEAGDSVEVSVETAVTETITVVTEEENGGDEQGDQLNEQNAVAAAEGEGCDGDQEEEENCDRVEEEDTVGNGEDANQETVLEQEGGEQNLDEGGEQNLDVKEVGGAAGTDKDNQEDGLGKNEDLTHAKEKNEEKVEARSKNNAKRSKRKKNKNNKRRKINETPQGKGKNKQVVENIASNGKFGKDSGKSNSKVGSPHGMDIGIKDKPESSRKLSSKKKAESSGMIFMCNSETKRDCYHYKVLGLPAGKKEMVEKIYKGMRLFLYDVDLKLMYGIYKATGPGGYNIEPKAFKSQFPSQVRFKVHTDCLPLAEETFRQAIKKNYYTRSKFDFLLSSEQVKDLCKLFNNASKGSRSKDTGLGFETPVTSKRVRAKRSRDGSRRADRAPRSGRAEARGYREHHHLHERSLVASPLVPLSPRQPLPPPAVQSYAYRTVVADPYRRDPGIQHNDSYRQGRLVEVPDPYRRDIDSYRHGRLVDLPADNPDPYRRVAIVEPRDYYRRERREYQPLNVEARLPGDVGINGPYTSYRERRSYQDPVIPVSSLPEYNPPPTGLRTEYRRGGTLLADYNSTRSALPEYPSSAAVSLYEYQSRQPQYPPY